MPASAPIHDDPVQPTFRQSPPPVQVLAVASPASGGPHSGARLQAGAVHLLSSTGLVAAATASSSAVVNFTVDELAQHAVTVLGGGQGTMLGRLGYSIAAGDVLTPGACVRRCMALCVQLVVVAWGCNCSIARVVLHRYVPQRKHHEEKLARGTLTCY